MTDTRLLSLNPYHRKNGGGEKFEKVPNGEVALNTLAQPAAEAMPQPEKRPGKQSMANNTQRSGNPHTAQ